MRPRVHQGIGHYLAEDFDVLRYNLKDETDIWQWTSLDYFVYTDKAGHDLSGEAAYTAAIREGYFDLIELSYGYHTPLAMQIDQNLTASKLYDLVARIPIHSSYGDGYFWLWSKHAGEPGSAETVVCKAICAWKIELNLEQYVEDGRTFALCNALPVLLRNGCRERSNSVCYASDHMQTQPTKA